MKHTNIKSMVSTLFTPRILLPALSAATLLLTPGAYAQPPNAAANATLTPLQEAQRHLREVQDKLTKIQEDTSKADPDIKKKEDDFQNYLASVMKAQGYKPDEEMKQMDELRAKIKDKSLPQSERSRGLMTFLRLKRHYQEGERKAMEVPKVQQAQQQLQADMVEAMKKHDPSTASLMQDMKDTEQKIKTLSGH